LRKEKRGKNKKKYKGMIKKRKKNMSVRPKLRYQTKLGGEEEKNKKGRENNGIS
jgi:hypothetical protein